MKDKIESYRDISTTTSGNVALKEMWIPYNVKTICKDEFWNFEKLAAINVDKENQFYTSIDGVLYNKNVTELIFVPLGKEGELIIPESVTKIPDNAFWHSSLTKVSLPPLVDKLEKTNDAIHKGLFFEAVNLSYIEFRNKKIQVRQYWFIGNNTHWRIQQKMNKLFYKILVELYPRQLCSSMFLGHYSGTLGRENILTLLVEDLKHDFEWKKAWCNFIKRHFSYFYKDLLEDLKFMTFVVDENIPGIKDVQELSKLANEQNLTEVSLLLLEYQNSHFSNSEIMEAKFSEMMEDRTSINYLKSNWNFKLKNDGSYIITGYKGNERDVIIPEIINGHYVTELGKDVFNPKDKKATNIVRTNRKNIKTIVMPDSITKIGEKCFWNCFSLTNVKLSSGLKKINKGALFRRRGCGLFFKCSNLHEIIIPEGVTKICELAFANCYDLKKIILPSTIKEIGDGCFANCILLKDINIPHGLNTISYDLFFNCRELRRIIIPESVEELNSNCFIYCHNLIVEIPNSVTKIQPSAFYQCENIEIHCKAGSYAEQFSKENNIPYKVLYKISSDDR